MDLLTGISMRLCFARNPWRHSVNLYPTFTGSGCGALGGAISISGMKTLRGSLGAIGLDNPKIDEPVERFSRCTSYEINCPKIVGKKFQDVGNHGRFIREGGCAEIIQALVNNWVVNARAHHEQAGLALIMAIRTSHLTQSRDGTWQDRFRLSGFLCPSGADRCGFGVKTILPPAML
jgi:hypothetical protein